ncbi:MAG: 3-carboxy-cis,cis-muconate lactonizing protein, partial [bacterium]|nr:3-carboxy-cis,cis-muconate lactonizing protein [bacterium]
FNAPGLEVTKLTVNSGGGGDRVVIEDHSATTEVYLGGGADTAELRTSDNGEITIDGEAGQDLIYIIQVGTTTKTLIQGGEDADLIQVAGDKLASGTETTVDGDNPTTSPGDVLRFDPGANPTLDPSDTTSPGSVGVSGKGKVDFQEIELVDIIAAPIITLPATAPTITEGGSLSLSVTVQPLGDGTLDEPVSWEINGGSFGEAFGTTLNMTWDQLKAEGINNGNGTYDLAVRAENSGFTTTEVITLTVQNTAPTIAINASSTAFVSADFALAATHSDPGADAPITWSVDWDTVDVNSPMSPFGAVTSIAASHVYPEPGTYEVTVALVDGDSAPNNATTKTHSVTVTVDQNDISAGVPYAIDEGQSLSLTASVVGTPSSVGWDLNNDGDFTDATGLAPTVTWAALETLGVDDSGMVLPVKVKVSYGNSQALTATTTLDITNIDPTATFATNAPAGGVNEGASLGTVKAQFTNSTDVAAGDVTAGFLYSFDFGNDGTFEISDQAAAFANVPASYMGDKGLVTVRGVITDKDLGFSEYTTSFQVKEVLPTFTLGGSASANEGDTYTLTMSNLVDPGIGDSLTSLTIDWGDGTGLETVDPTLRTFTHVFKDNQSGQTTISVTGADGDGSKTVTKLVNVSNVAPSLSNVAAALASGLGVIVEGDLVKLTGDISDPGVLDTFSLAIDWGDGVTDTPSLPAGATGIDARHRYKDDGNYTISLTITDDDSDTDSKTTSVTVTNAAPQLTLELEASTIDETGTSVLSGTISDAGILDTHTVFINWKDGGSPEEATVTNRAFSVSHVYADDNPDSTSLDVYDILVTVTDKLDATSKATPTISQSVQNLIPQVIVVTTDAPDLANSV